MRKDNKAQTRSLKGEAFVLSRLLSLTSSGLRSPRARSRQRPGSLSRPLPTLPWRRPWLWMRRGTLRSRQMPPPTRARTSIRRDRGAPHLLVRSAWSCDACGHIYATFAKLHRGSKAKSCCAQAARLSLKERLRLFKSRVKRFEATEKQARKCKHTLTPAEFENLFEAAKAALFRGDPAPS